MECKEVSVLEDFYEVRGELVEGRADQDRAFHGGPQGEVRARFRVREGAVADLEHVGVGVAPEVGAVQVEGVFVYDLDDAVPVGLSGGLVDGLRLVP